MKDLFKIADLIAGARFNQLSESEKTELNNWLNESERNKELFDELLNNNLFDSNISNYSQNTEKKWSEFESVIAKKRKVIKLRALIRYAAVVITLIGFAYLMNTFLNAETEMVVEHTIKPGTSKATLQLSDGSVLNLNEINESSIQEQNGAEILKSGNKLQYNGNKSSDELAEKFNTISTPKGGEYNLVLSDGTKVWLNAESELSYPVNFVGKQRGVYLKGEAYFEVVENTEQPFIVSFADEKVEVLGTAFNIKSYTDEKTFQTTLVEGKVKYFSKSKELILEPNQQAEVNIETAEVELKKVNSSDFIAWKQGTFLFKNQTLESILSSISRWYNVEIVYQNENTKGIRFTGKLKRYDRIEKILEMLEATKKVKITAKENKLVVTQAK